MMTPGEYYHSEFFRFHNGIRILLNIDIMEFPGPREDWAKFRDNPWRYFVTCGDEIALRLWEIIRHKNSDAVRHFEERQR